MGRVQEQRPLVDRKRGHRFDPEQPRLQLLPFVGMGGGDGVEIGPCLARGGHVLTLILANRATVRAGIVGGSAGFTECNHVLSSAIKH